MKASSRFLWSALTAHVSTYSRAKSRLCPPSSLTLIPSALLVSEKSPSRATKELEDRLAATTLRRGPRAVAPEAFPSAQSSLAPVLLAFWQKGRFTWTAPDDGRERPSHARGARRRDPRLRTSTRSDGIPYPGRVRDVEAPVNRRSAARRDGKSSAESKALPSYPHPTRPGGPLDRSGARDGASSSPSTTREAFHRYDERSNQDIMSLRGSSQRGKAMVISGSAHCVVRAPQTRRQGL